MFTSTELLRYYWDKLQQKLGLVAMATDDEDETDHTLPPVSLVHLYITPCKSNTFMHYPPVNPVHIWLTFEYLLVLCDFTTF